MSIAAYGTKDGWTLIDEVLSSPGRGGGRLINNKISYDAFEAGNYIARTNTGWNGAGVTGQSAEVTYSFPTWEGIYYNAAGNTGLRGFNEYQKDQARLSLQSWADVANITFTEVEAGRGKFTPISLSVISMINIHRRMPGCRTPQITMAGHTQMPAALMFPASLVQLGQGR